MGQAFAAWALWLLGSPDQARQRIYEAWACAQELAQPFSLVYALTCAAIVHGFRREGSAIQKWAEEVMALSREQGFPCWATWGMILRGWALVTQGQGSRGDEPDTSRLGRLPGHGGGVFRPSYLVLLAETYGNMGQTDEGLSILAEAVAAVEHSEARWWEAELYRLKGELLLRRASPIEEAEACFRQALAVA